MKPKLILLALGTLLLSASATEAQQPKPIPDQYIVVLKETAAKAVIKDQKKNNNREQKANANKAARDKALAKVKEIHSKKNIKSSAIVAEYADVIVGFAAKLTGQEKKALEDDPDVAEVQQDYYIELGPVTEEPNPSDVGMNFNSPQETGPELNLGGPNYSAPDHTFVDQRNSAYAQYTSCAVSSAGGYTNGSTKATWIWILDTGIDLDHPDLNVQTSSTFAKSFISGQTVEDGKGHGTHCAGIAAAKNNTFGVVGVSAGARVVPVKVLSNTGSGAWSSLLAGLNHVAKYDIPGDVVSMSLGGYGYSNCENSWSTLRDVIRALGNAGTYVCMAAGNDAGDAVRNRPGCINGNRVYTVGAITCTNGCASYSNFNTSLNVPVDWVAVGSGVYSTYKNGGYATLSGTSMATPVVAGIIHARGGPPVVSGYVTCKGKSYRRARR